MPLLKLIRAEVIDSTFRYKTSFRHDGVALLKLPATQLLFILSLYDKKRLLFHKEFIPAKREKFKVAGYDYPIKIGFAKYEEEAQEYRLLKKWF
jgi:hypothetical protein